MSTVLALIYQYRQLLAKCESSRGLTLDEIELFSTLETLLDPASDLRIGAKLRSRRLADLVEVVLLGRRGAVATDCPHLEVGQQVELRFDETELSLSYRFAARVEWVRRGPGNSIDAALSFIGAPIVVHKAQLSSANPDRAEAA